MEGGFTNGLKKKVTFHFPRKFSSSSSEYPHKCADLSQFKLKSIYQTHLHAILNVRHPEYKTEHLLIRYINFAITKIKTNNVGLLKKKFNLYNLITFMLLN